MRALVIGLAALLILAGCAENPVTGRREFVVVSEEQAIQSSAVAYREMMGQLEKKKQVESGTPRAARVRAIADRLIAEAARLRPETAKWTWEVKVIDEPKTVNAFAMATGLATSVAAVAISRDSSTRDLALSGLELGAALAITLPNSRQSESEADAIGIELAANAGFDPQAAVTLWEKMGRQSAAPPEFLSTHPSPENRRERLQALAKKLEPVYRAAKRG